MLSPDAAQPVSLTFRPASSGQTGAKVLVAISGGSDSTALLHLLHNDIRQSSASVSLIAATVDHGLRPASAQEAREVAAQCTQLGVPHETLVWAGDKPSSGLQAAARLARHRLLAAHAERAGCTAVLTGHTQDDQLETLMMRGARGQGGGLAGIAPATLFENRVWFHRPLLGHSRAKLRAELSARRVSWIDDPSNEDERFERVRIRREAADLTPQERGAILQQGAAAADERRALAGAAARLIGSHVRRVADGLIKADHSLLNASRDGAVHVLRILLAVAGGAQHLPSAGAAATAFDRLQDGRKRFNLSRALVDVRADGLYFLRESRALPPDMPAEDGQIWDRRFRKTAVRAAAPFEPDALAPPALVAKARATLPSGDGWTPVLAPWSDFLPSFDLEAAQALAAAIGGICPPPSGGHIGLQLNGT